MRWFALSTSPGGNVRSAIYFSLMLAVLVAGACSKRASQNIVRVDGSSTIYPLTEAIAEEYQKEKRTRVTIGVSGTGGGFKKFCKNEIPIIGASRPITDHEIAECGNARVGYIELPLAYEGIVVAVNNKNDWVSGFTTEELKKMWEPSAQGKITKWKQINPSWPDKEIHLFSPGVDSGTYDYFTLAIVGKEHASRGDMTSSEDDNVLVQGVAGDPLAVGFFGLSYYLENKDKIKALPINGVLPSLETIGAGKYQPLSRPLFIYVSVSGAADKNVQGFVEYFLGHGPSMMRGLGFVELSEALQGRIAKRFKNRETGSVFVAKRGLQTGPMDRLYSGN